MDPADRAKGNDMDVSTSHVLAKRFYAPIRETEQRVLAKTGRGLDFLQPRD